MSSKYPLLSPNKIISVLSKLDFERVSQKGSHVKLKNPWTNRICIIPMHQQVARGTLKSILEQAGVELEVFLNHLF